MCGRSRYLLYEDSVPSYMQQSGWDQAKTGSQELKLDLQLWMAGLRCLNHHLLPSRVHFTTRLELELQPKLEPKHSDMGHWHLWQALCLYSP